MGAWAGEGSRVGPEARGLDLYRDAVIRELDCPDYIGRFVIGELAVHPYLVDVGILFTNPDAYIYGNAGLCGWGNGSELA